MPLACRLDRDRAPERLAVTERDHHARHQAERSQVAQPLGLALVHPPDLDRLADVHVGERRTGELVNGSVGIGNRIAVRVDRGVSQGRGHALDQGVRHRVLQPLGLHVHRVPTVAEKLDQVGLDEPVAPHHAQRRDASRLGELHPLVGDVLEQTQFREALDHAAHGRGGKVEQPGDIAGRGRAAFWAKPVNGLEIVFDRPGQRIGAGSCVHAKS